MSQAGPRVGRADTRQQAQASWSLSVFVLNGALFVLVGLQLQAAVRGLAVAALACGLIAVGAVSAVVIGVRFAWLYTTPYVIRLLDRRPQQRLRRAGARARVVSGVAGFRGAVSLAAIPQLAAGLGTDPEVAGRLRREYQKHLRILRAGEDGADDEPALRYDQHYTALRLAVLAHKRATVLRLRDERRIDDTVLRQVQTRLDIEEVRLSRRELVD
jgi:monovalent cation/hydrogen antiporter